MKIRKAFTMRASSIGDCLMGKYLLEQIHASYPEAKCSIVVASRAGMIRDLLAAYPWITVHEASRHNLRGLWETVRAVWGSDATVTQYTGKKGKFSTLSKLFARLVTRRGRLVGFEDSWQWNKYLFDHLIPFDMRHAMRLHECDALESLGIPIHFQEIKLISQSGSGVLNMFSLLKNSYIVLNLFSGSKSRGFSLEHQRAIARIVSDTFRTQKKIILTGGLSDEPLMQSIKEKVPEVVLAPGLSMQDLITLVAESAAVVSLDTGVAHIAAQTGVQLVVIRTCLGFNWWNKDQYQREGITILAHDECCANGHVAIDFPPCLGTTSPEEINKALQETLLP
jgi:ADP-heptose:LPS heptosyltransferase